MAQQFFRRIDGQSVGPLTAKMLKELCSQGEVPSDEQIFCDQNKQWVAAGKIQGLVFATPSDLSKTAAMRPAVSGEDQITLPPPLDVFAGDVHVAAGASPGVSLESFSDSSPLPPESFPESVVSSPKSATAAPAHPPRPVGIIVGAVLGVIVLIGAACTGTYLLAKGGAEPVAKPGQEELSTELKVERDRLRKEIDGFKIEVRELEDQRNGLQRDADALDKTKNELNAEIKKLTTQREILHRWKGVDLVLMNSKQQAVGLKKVGIDSSGASFTVFDKQEGELAETVLAASRNLHIARTSEDAQLAKEVYNRVKPGDVLPVDLAERLRKTIWKTHSFVKVRPDTSTTEIDLAVFRDLVTNEVRMGYLHESSKDGIRIEAQGASRELIPWSQMQAGSARHGTPDMILPMLGNVDFLEYSLLRVAQKIGTGDAVRMLPRVIVHCDMEISKDHIQHYQDLDRQLAEQGSMPTYYTGDSDFSAALQFISEMNRAMIPGRRAALRQEMLRTDPNRRERHLAQYVEGEVEKQLSQGWGISTVSDKDLAKFEQGSTSIGQAVRAATLHDATHLLMITVKEPRTAGDYHLSVKLFDETGKDTWVNEGERDLSPEPMLERFHVSSGELVVLTRRDKLVSISRETPKDSIEKATLLMVAESPLVAPYVGARSPGERRSELVYLESKDEFKTRFRTLFDRQVKEISSGAVESTVPVINSHNDVSQDLILRYVVARISEQLLSPAGRVERVQGLTGEISGLTTSRGVTPGQRCRVLRAGGGIEPLSILPTEAELSHVGDAQGLVTFHESGFEKLWPDNVLLKAGDHLIPRNWTPRSLRVEALQGIEPDPKVKGRLEFADSGVRDKFAEYTRQAAAKISNLLADALPRTGIPTSAPDLGLRDFPTTHQVFGTITLSKKMAELKYSKASSPVFTVHVMLAEVGSKKDPLQITFDVSKFLD